MQALGFGNIDAQNMFTLQLLKLGDTIKLYKPRFEDVLRDFGNTLSLYAVLTHGIVSHRTSDLSTINECMTKLDKE